MSSRWWEWFDSCEDNLGLCQTNIDAITKLSGGSVIKALQDDKELSFSIMRQTDVGFIPQNYFCKWEVNIDSK